MHCSDRLLQRRTFSAGATQKQQDATSSAVQFMLDHLMSHGRQILRNTVHLGQYGADRDKPVWLYCLEELQLPEYAPENSSSSSSLPVTVETLGLCKLCTSDAICWNSHDVRHTNAAGERRCSGGPGLKSSQTYPKMCLVHKRCSWVACVHALVVCPGFQCV